MISIHAPAGGATTKTGATGDALEISIHAPAGGATAIFANFRPYISLNIANLY